MKRTLLVTIDFWPQLGGVADYYFNLCRQLKDQVVVLTCKMSKRANTERLKQDYNFKIIRKKLLLNWIRPRWLMMPWHIWTIINKEKIDIIWAGEVLPTGRAVNYLSRLLKLSYIISCHGNDLLQARQNRRKEKMAAKILRAAKWVTVNSKKTGQLVESFGVNRDRIKVIYPGVEPNSRRPRSWRKQEIVKKYNLQGKKLLLSVGRLIERKGFDKVIEAMPKVMAQIPGVIYLIAGEGSDRKRLEQLAGGAEQIIFLGEVSDEEKWILMELCDVFVMPARSSRHDIEGFGIVYLEAGLCAKPVIAGNSGGGSEAVLDRQTGLVVESESPSAISLAVIELFRNVELAKNLAKAGKKRVEENFSWQKVAAGLKKILE